jgi:ferrochelatase
VTASTPRSSRDRPAIGVVLANLGSPSEPTTRAVRRYLAEFLADRRVVDAPRLPWWLLRQLVILPLRAPRSAALYRRIWTAAGAPLPATTGRLAAALGNTLGERVGAPVEVVAGMRYGEPSIASALRALAGRGCGRILVLPLFPQYSATTTASVGDAVWRGLASWRSLPEVRLALGYHDHPAYIAALGASLRSVWAERPAGEHLLVSFHGLPRRYAEAGDPYPEQCRESARLLAASLGLGDDRWTMGYQSRFGRQAWLEPATDTLLSAWGAKRLASVDVICPGFAADCLETLEEVAVAGRALFTGAGGGELRYCPALNERPEHAAALAEVALGWMQGWVAGTRSGTGTGRGTGKEG